VRKNSDKFIRVNEREEPPLRTLDHGLAGEFRKVESGEIDPYPYVLKTRDGKCYHGFRFDQDVCDEAAHVNDYLMSRCGSNDSNTNLSFRQVLTYQGGVSSKDDDLDQEAIEHLKEILLPAALKVFGEEDNEEAKKASSLFSIYTNFLVPGHNIKLHLDVPEFVGLDRSTCPSWLLIAAKCSGLFSDYRVRNVTCVCYPRDANGGEILFFDGDRTGRVIPVKQGTAAVQDTDSLFHVVGQVRNASSSSRDEVIQGPELPQDCKLSVDPALSTGEIFWNIEDIGGNKVVTVREDEVRFSLSCKFHIFRNAQEADNHREKKRKLSATQIIETLTKDLEERGILETGSKMDLFDLAPLFVKVYILPLSPSSTTIESVWRKYERAG